MDTTSAPQIIEHAKQSVTYTPFDVKWIPSAAKFVVVGQTPRAKGIMEIFQMNEGKLELAKTIQNESGFKCCSFGASSISSRELATGDFSGGLELWDLEVGKPTFQVKAHKSIINHLDAIGGQGNIGPAEIVTAGRDGNCRIWDPRTSEPVVRFEPSKEEKVLPECWAVRFQFN